MPNQQYREGENSAIVGNSGTVPSKPIKSWYRRHEPKSQTVCVSHAPPVPPLAPPAPPLAPLGHTVFEGRRDRVKVLAKQLEEALCSTPDTVPGSFFLARAPRHRASLPANGEGEQAAHEDSRRCTPPNTTRGTASPSRPGANPQATQSLHKLRDLFESSSETHEKLWKKALKRQSSILRWRGSFANKLGSEHVVMSRIDAFWRKFRVLMNSPYTLDTTPGSILGSVLIAIVEARQVCLDVFEFGQRVHENFKTISKTPLMAHLLTTTERLEKLRDDLLYWVGQRRALRVYASIKAEENGGMRQDVATEQAPLPAVVRAPLLLMKERLQPWDHPCTSKLMPELRKIQSTIAFFQGQNYEDWIMLLFEADTFGKAAMELDENLRQKLYSTIFQVFVTARANALAMLSNIGLDM